jgi:YggT family protein
MFILGDILITAANILSILLSTYQFIVLVAVIISWVRPNPDNDFIRGLVRMVIQLTEPVFRWVRQRLPRSWFASGVDFSPLLVLLALYAANMLLYRILMNIGVRLSNGIAPMHNNIVIP